jgi:energy-coupling factor transporter transmembrane protein EcfT
MNRKLLYAGLVLVNLMPFIYAFFKGYSFIALFANLIAFVAGKEYDALLFLLVLMALLLSVAFVFTSTSATTSGSAKKHVILHPSDGRRIAEENQQKVLQLQQLLHEGEQEPSPTTKRRSADSGLDMIIT